MTRILNLNVSNPLPVLWLGEDKLEISRIARYVEINFEDRYEYGLLAVAELKYALEPGMFVNKEVIVAGGTKPMLCHLVTYGRGHKYGLEALEALGKVIVAEGSKAVGNFVVCKEAEVELTKVDADNYKDMFGDKPIIVNTLPYKYRIWAQADRLASECLYPP